MCVFFELVTICYKVDEVIIIERLIKQIPECKI